MARGASSERSAGKPRESAEPELPYLACLLYEDGAHAPLPGSQRRLCTECRAPIWVSRNSIPYVQRRQVIAVCTYCLPDEAVPAGMTPEGALDLARRLRGQGRDTIDNVIAVLRSGPEELRARQAAVQKNQPKH
jgi:hypothetical protein